MSEGQENQEVQQEQPVAQEDANAELNSIKSTLESLTPQSSNTEYEQVLDSINSLQGDNGLSNKGEAYLKVALDTYEDKVQLRDERGALLTDLEPLYSEIDTQMSADKFGEFDSDTINSLEKELTNMVTTNASFLNQNVDMPQYYSKLKDIDEWIVAGNLLKSKDELPLELIGINEILDMKNVETDAIEGQEFMNAPFAQGQSPFKFNAYDLDGNQGVGREILLGGASPDKYRAKGANTRSKYVTRKKNRAIITDSVESTTLTTEQKQNIKTQDIRVKTPGSTTYGTVGPTTVQTKISGVKLLTANTINNILTLNKGESLKDIIISHYSGSGNSVVSLHWSAYPLKDLVEGYLGNMFNIIKNAERNRVMLLQIAHIEELIRPINTTLH